MLGRLTESMFVEILREYMQPLPTSQGGWFAAVNDAQIGKALRLLHANPVRDWTVEELAREVGLSRSVLAHRFVELVGEAPMRDLVTWRMQLAKQMMREGAHNIQEVATRVGYESEAAFNRAGVAPVRYCRPIASIFRDSAQFSTTWITTGDAG
jgi:AraC-like DNA-binding protein